MNTPRTVRLLLVILGASTWTGNGVLVAADPSQPIPARELAGAGPPLVPQGMQLRGWRETGADAVDGWIPFRFGYALPPEGVTGVEFYLTVQPIGQLTETDCFYCLDQHSKGVLLHCNFARYATGRKHIVRVYIDEQNDPGILQQVRTGGLECVLQDDTALVDALRDTDSSVRMAAAVGIGSIGAVPPTAAAVPALIRALDDPSGLVRAEAARSLGEVWQDGESFGAAVAALQRLLDDPDGRVREAAAESLAILGL